MPLRRTSFALLTSPFRAWTQRLVVAGGFMLLIALSLGQAAAWAACPGCCSSHGGISNSCGTGGRVLCKDGTTSPSCSCSSCGVASSTPVCTPKSESRTIACPAGQTGSITETRAYTCSLGGMWSTWSVASSSCKAESLAGRVISVTDGDTLTVQGSGTDSSVIRLAEIDAPEKCQPYGAASRDSLVQMAMNQQATVTVTDRDQYGRVVGKVQIAGQGSTVNRQQIERGMAWAYDAYLQDWSLDTLEAQARAQGLGLWAGASPMPPWEWRRQSPSCSRDVETNAGATVVAGTTATSAITAGLPRAVEYFNSANGHFFMTASASDANLLDQGVAGPIWARTGNTFSVWPASSSEPGTVEVCRFYSHGVDSHFFTAKAADCQWLRDFERDLRAQASAQGVDFRGWGYEGIAFRAKLPDAAGQCPAGTEPVYRAYNNRHELNDPNHRFTPWLPDIEVLQAKGWVYEGVAMCAPK